MSGSPYTSGSNFSAYLPKVSYGDRATYEDINLLSKAVTRNAVTSGVGVTIKRTTNGTSIVSNDGVGDYIPFLIHIGTDSSGDVVVMMTLSQANIWAGSGFVTVPANQDFDYQTTGQLNLPVGDFTYGSEFIKEQLSPVTTEEFPRYMYWKGKGGERIVWFELDEDMLKPALRYTSLERYERFARRAHAIPIAYIDGKYNVLQINSGTIWADPLNLRRKNRHPWQVRIREDDTEGTKYIKIETGSVISYPAAFVDIMSDTIPDCDYPFAIKRGESLGGEWHVNDNESWPVEDGEYIYLQFKRDVGAETYYAQGSDNNQWKCTINKGKDLPEQYYRGNYNTHAYSTCGALNIPECGQPWTKYIVSVDPVPFIPNTYLYLEMQNKKVQFVSDGLLVYPLAKIYTDTTGELAVRQIVKSDFYFQPPLDAHFGFEVLVENSSSIPSNSSDIPPNE